MADAVLLRNLAQIATPVGSAPRRGSSMRELRVIPNACILVEDGLVAWLGKESDLPPGRVPAGIEEIDTQGGTAIPGLVDSHTHLPFAGYRESEFNRRIAGETYQDIARSGGGIASTVATTRAASRDLLASLVVERTRRMAAHGTTTAEAKSGYGLDLENEIKQLEAVRIAADGAPVDLIATALPGHDFPPGLDRGSPARNEWIDEVTESILPTIAARGLAEFNDVFVEEGVFTVEEGARILQAGAALGLRPRMHADELSDTSGAALAVEAGAFSADHLMEVSEQGIARLAASRTVANLLPGTSLFLMSRRFAPARKLIDAGAVVALSTDCNPGSSMTESMQIVMQLACLQMGLTVEEALTAATLHGAIGLGRGADRGTLEIGKRADVTVIDAPSYLHLVYHYGVNLVRWVLCGGRVVVANGARVSGQRSGQGSQPERITDPPV